MATKKSFSEGVDKELRTVLQAWRMDYDSMTDVQVVEWLFDKGAVYLALLAMNEVMYSCQDDNPREVLESVLAGLMDRPLIQY